MNSRPLKARTFTVTQILTSIALILALFTRPALATPPVVTHGTGLLATVASDGTAEYGWDDTVFSSSLRINIEVVNIGTGAVTLKLSPGITDTTPQTSPQPADLEYVLPAGASVTLPSFQNTFYHRAESGHGTTLSLIVHT